jgi:hypothetical protein
MKEHPIYRGYLVSEDGRVFSAWKQEKVGHNAKLDYNNIKKLNPRNNTSGYLQVTLRINKKDTNKLVHRLVAETYLEPPHCDYLQINHIDKNRHNNNVTNLEWVTAQQNIEHSCTKVYYIENIKNSEIIKIKNFAKWCRNNQISKANLYKTIDGRRTHTKGYRLIKKIENEFIVPVLELDEFGQNRLPEPHEVLD